MQKLLIHFQNFLECEIFKSPKWPTVCNKLFETNKGNFSGSKPIIGRRITFNPEEIGAFGPEQFFYILYYIDK